MEDLYLKLDQVLKFFTTDNLTGLPQKIGRFTCTTLTTSGKEPAGYLIQKNTELYFFPAASMAAISGLVENANIEMESFIEQKWNERKALNMN